MSIHYLQYHYETNYIHRIIILIRNYYTKHGALYNEAAHYDGLL